MRPHTSPPAASAAALTALLTAALLAAACASAPISDPERAPDARTARRTEQVVAITGPATEAVVRLDANRVPPVEARVNAPVEQAYAALVAAYDEVGLPPNATDPDTHTIGAINVPVGSKLGNAPLTRYVSCGSGSIGEGPLSGYRVRLTMRTRVTQDGPGSVISTQLLALGDHGSTSGNQLRCYSSGRLENAVAKALQTSLAPAPAAK